MRWERMALFPEYIPVFLLGSGNRTASVLLNCTGISLFHFCPCFRTANARLLCKKTQRYYLLLLIKRGECKWDEGNTKQKVMARWCCHPQTCRRFSGQHSRRWLWMSIARGLERQRSGSSSGHGRPSVKMPNVTEVLEKWVAPIEKSIFSRKSKFHLLEHHPQTWNTPYPLFWDLEGWNGSLSINSLKTNLWGRWCQSRGFCRGSVGEPICQYCSCCFSSAFTNWYSGSCLCCR